MQEITFECDLDNPKDARKDDISDVTDSEFDKPSLSDSHRLDTNSISSRTIREDSKNEDETYFMLK